MKFPNKLLWIMFAIFVSQISYAQHKIQLSYEAGVYTMPCEVNGLIMKFIFDTGASNVALSLTEAQFMLKNGYLKESDFSGKTKVQIANGDIVNNDVVILKKIVIGNRTLYGVKATISNSLDAPLLLGQSAISKLGEWCIRDGYLYLFENGDTNNQNDSISKEEINIKYFEERALQGDIHAQLKLFLYYFEEENDVPRAIMWLHKAAEAGDAEAQNLLATFLNQGIGVEQDHEKALYWRLNAAENGFTPAQCSLGLEYLSGQGLKKDKKQGIAWLQKAAENKNIDAQIYLARIYSTGEYGIKKDKSLAISWYKRAANNNSPKATDAQHELAMLYYNDKDYSNALIWHQQAAEEGNDYRSQCIIGIMYYYALGVDQNFNLAANWFLKSAEHGEYLAQYMLGYMYYYGEGVEQNYYQAFYWYQESANKGFAMAQYELGRCYQNGNGVDANFSLAIHWWRKAAIQGDKSAQQRLKYYDYKW